MRGFGARAMASVLAIVGLAATARAADYDASLVTAAQGEGEVVWYTSFVQNQLARPMADAFEKRFPGIKVRLVTGTVSDLLTRLLGEGRAGAVQGDVSHAGNAVGPLRRAGLLLPYVAKSASAYPAAYRDPEGYWTAEVIYALAPAVNTNLVPPDQRPKRYEDLLDPRWKGKLPWTNQMAQSGPPAFIAMIQQTMGAEKSREYFKAIAPNIVNVPANQRVVLDQVMAGEYPMAMMMFNHHVDISKRAGAPLEWLPLDPVVETMDTVFLLKGRHPNAGKLMVEFILSDDGQRVFKDAGYTAAHPAFNPLLAPGASGRKSLVLTPEQVDAGIDDWIKTFETYFR